MKIGVCFGGYCPMHLGHLSVIKKAYEENDKLILIVCGYDNEQRAKEINMDLGTRTSIINTLKNSYTNIDVYSINDTELGIDESCSDNNWKIWTNKVREISGWNDDNEYTWYVAEPDYKIALEKLGYNIILMDRSKIPITGTMIRKQPYVYWDYITDIFKREWHKYLS